MTQAEIIEAAHGRTGRRAEENGVDASYLLLSCIQEICMEARWPWRKKTSTFTTVAGTSVYDITSSSYGSVTDFEELRRAYRVDSVTSLVELSVVTDDGAVASAQVDTTQADPTGIMLSPGTADSFQLTPVPNGAKAIRYLYWAIPSALDSSVGTVPLIPARWHFVIVKRLEAAFWASLPKEGEGGTNYQRAIAEYQHGLALMLAKTKFANNEVRNWNVQGEAVAST